MDTTITAAPSLEEMIEFIHCNTPSHGGWAVGCDQWPCTTLSTRHRFSTDAKGRNWNEPGECYLCGKRAAHANHGTAIRPRKSTQSKRK